MKHLLELVPATDAAIAARAATNGGNKSLAAAQLRTDLHKRLAELKETCPKVHEQAVTLVREAATNLNTARDIIMKGSETYNALRVALLDRGALREQVESLEAELAAGKAKLADKSCLDLGEAALFALGKRVEFLPAEIRDLKAKIADLSKQITAAKDFDVSAVVAAIRAESTPRETPVVWRQLERGFISSGTVTF